jgi:hypothetical protein
VIVPEDAETVRTMFRLYLECGSVGALAKEFARRNMMSKVKTFAGGCAKSGGPYSIEDCHAIGAVHRRLAVDREWRAASPRRERGDLAVISQSGAIVAGMIEWAGEPFPHVSLIGESGVFSLARGTVISTWPKVGRRAPSMRLRRFCPDMPASR